MVSGLILGKYRIVKRLGAGAYDTDAALDAPAKYAVKLERASKKKLCPPSEHEANVLRALADDTAPTHIPGARDYGYDKPQQSQALVIDLLGADIESLRREHDSGKLSVKATMLITIHSRHFIHRDIKPGNILLGPEGDEGFINLVDFAIARRFRNPRNGVHQPFVDGKLKAGLFVFRCATLSFRGSYTTSTQTRRDDIESLAYTLLDCMRELPWGASVREKKKSWTLKRLTVRLPDVFKILLCHARDLAYDEAPAYDFLRSKFCPRTRKTRAFAR
ncbi:kinase-like protein [Leucogyrophana mollusca]|uniref:Kinase-like protein n=1 Tax=Leucogyrophana mollusca TaxID=85980 RepID=A0ACB8BD15_9AGAM|nr:kinase-like protein [Leucogyrophana mollusca]